MDFDRLKAEIKEIAEIAQSVPEQFRSRCFELLLANLLGGDDAGSRSTGGNGGAGIGETGSKLPKSEQGEVRKGSTIVARAAARSCSPVCARARSVDTP